MNSPVYFAEGTALAYGADGADGADGEDDGPVTDVRSESENAVYSHDLAVGRPLRPLVARAVGLLHLQLKDLTGWACPVKLFTATVTSTVYRSYGVLHQAVRSPRLASQEACASPGVLQSQAWLPARLPEDMS